MMKLSIKRKKLISTKGQNLNLSFFNGYKLQEESKQKLDEIVIETIISIAQPKDGTEQNTNENKE